MIARCYVFLPFTLSVRRDDALLPEEFPWGDYRVRVYPPLLALIDPAILDVASAVSVHALVHSLCPAPDQTPCWSILVDGSPVIQANTLKIDFCKNDFDRRPPVQDANSIAAATILTAGDPPLEVVFQVANGLLARLRSVIQSSHIHVLDPGKTLWHMVYLTDNEEELPFDQTLIRRRYGTNLAWRLSVVNQDAWTKVQLLPPNYTPHPWDTLILDANAALPDVGAALSLANAALEGFSIAMIGKLASAATLPTGLWEWVNKRGDWYKEPSVDDRFDPLLRAFTGKSLKDDARLWAAYKNLRNARNSFSHGGKAVIGKDEVTPIRAGELVKHAGEIVAWCEALLPDGLRRPVPTGRIRLELMKLLTPGPIPEMPPAIVAANPPESPGGVEPDAHAEPD